jgi:uncharacterized protein (TIGR03437 family)
VLVNNTKNDGTPYFLTAHHCLSRGQYFMSPPTVYWNYNGGSTLPPPETRSVGAYLLDTGPASDFSLLRLSYLPQGVRFAGWSAQRPAAATSVVSIHHPQASYKRFSNGQTVSGCTDEQPGADCNFVRVRWQGGITEPGSSGAPLFTGPPSDPRVVGLLSSGTSSCDNRSGYDLFGRFDLTFNAIAFYLTGQGCATALWPTEAFYGSTAPFKTYHVFSAAGGTGSVRLKAIEGENCAWSAASNVNWVTLTSATSGLLENRGEATITYTVAPYSGTRPRSGLILVGNQSMFVVQGGVSSCRPEPIGVGQVLDGLLGRSNCRSTVDSDAFADRYTFSAQAGQQIAVSLSSNAFDTFLMVYAPDGTLLDFNDDHDGVSNSRVPETPYQALTLPTSGTYTIEATSFFSGETGSYFLKLERFCYYSLTPAPPTPTLFPAAGGTGVLNIAGPPDCAWQATSNAPWLTFNSATSGVGNGTLAFTVAPNPAVAISNGVSEREGVILIGETRYVVRQSPNCGFYVTPTSISVQAESGYYGASGKDIWVSTGFGCRFTARSNVPWIEFPEHGSEYSAEGSQTVSFKFNSIKPGNEPRTGTITIGDQTVTVTQEPMGTLCAAAALSIGQTINDSLTPNCRSLLGYTGAVKQYRFRGRAGQKIAVALSSAELSVRVWLVPLNADGSINLNWRLDAAEPYLSGLTTVHTTQSDYATLPSDGDYLIEVASAYRPDTPTGRYVLTLSEVVGMNCVYVLTPLRSSYTARAATDSLSIGLRAGSGCSWTATSTVPWITITSGASGTGAGTVNYAVAANPGGFRVGTIVAAGWHLTITQQPSNPLAVVSAADYSADLTVGQIAALFGAGLATQTATAQALPLPTQLAGTQVTFKDQGGRTDEAPLFLVSPTQINFLIPYGLQFGPLTVTVRLNGTVGATTTVQLTFRAPRLFTADGSGRGVPAGYITRVRGDGSRVIESLFERDAAGRVLPRPISMPDGDFVYLTLYGTGFGLQNTTYSQDLDVQLGSLSLHYGAVAYPAPNFTGLDQINMLLPREARGQGDVTLTLMVPEGTTAPPSKPVTLRFAEALSVRGEQ